MKTVKQARAWAATMRMKYKQGKLTQEEIKTLESIPGWKWTYRFTIEDAKEFAESIGYTLHSTVYTSTRDHYDWECDNGHLVRMRYESLRRGHRCKYCNKNK